MTTTVTDTPSTTQIRASDVNVGPGEHLRVQQTGRPGDPALLFLHGSGPGVSALSNWEAVLLALGDSFHCIAPDIYGFGDSSFPDPVPQGFKANAELRIDKLFALIDALKLTKVTLVGNSMGGMYSLRIAQQRPELVERLVLMGSGGMPGLTPTPGLIKLITFYDDPTPENMADLLLLFVHDKASFGPRIQEIAKERMRVTSRPEVRASHLGMFAPGEMLSFSPEELAGLTMPALVIAGRDDVIVPIDASYYLAEHLPNADLYVMSRCGHWTQVEQPSRFQTIVREFAEGRL